MITVTTSEQKTQSEKPFPKLMISNDDGLIVLFNQFKEGTVVRPSKDWSIGHYDISWAMECFTDFNESITLQNI